MKYNHVLGSEIMTKKEKVRIIINRLKARYPNALCSLQYDEPYKLLIATRLAAQCTDARVNTVTKTLFAKYPNIEELASADQNYIIEIVKPCGLGNTKGRDIVKICQKLIDQFDGKVPDNMKDLLSLPGVGRKTANLILGDVYKKPAIVTDTHLIRISNRLGLVSEKNPTKVEYLLIKIVPPEESSDFCHRVVIFGREVCRARKPDCKNCELIDLCQNYII